MSPRVVGTMEIAEKGNITTGRITINILIDEDKLPWNENNVLSFSLLSFSHLVQEIHYYIRLLKLVRIAARSRLSICI